MSNILERLQPIFRDVLDQPNLRVERTDSGKTVDGWDSLAHISLIGAIEADFGIRFALGELEELKNIGDLIDVIERKQLGR